MSWFEFQMYVEKFQQDSKQRLHIHETGWDQTRTIWTVLMNSHFKKDGGGKFTLQDLITLSFDKSQETAIQEKPNLEVFEKLVKKHGKRKKKRNGK